MMWSYKQTDNLLQWTGAWCIGFAHLLNALGSDFHQNKWNQLAFWAGTIMFLIWAIRVANKPQMWVNIVAITVISLGLIKQS